MTKSALLAKLLLLPKPLLLFLCLTASSHGILQASALTGDSWCGTLMCVKATVNNSLVTYELKSLNQLGWMSIGFGSVMKDSPMVILWPNGDGTVTISQRQAEGHIQPTPVPSPPRRATLSPYHMDLSTQSTPTLAFDIPKNNDTLQQLIWAFGITRPGPDPSTDLEQHLDAGPFSLNLTKALDTTPISAASSSTLSPTPTFTSLTSASLSPIPSSQSSSTPPISHAGSRDKVLTAHAVLSFIGFLILLPLAALVARWGRTKSSRWFKAHLFINVILSIPIITIGCAMGYLSVSRRRRAHVVNEHQIGGVILFALYIIQVSLGTLIHLRRPKLGRMHPPRNIVHVILGLLIIGFGFIQTKTGISRDWEISIVGEKVLTALWIVWIIIIPSTYLVGLKHLRRQFDQERLGWHESIITPINASQLVSHIRHNNQTESDTARLRRIIDRTADDGTHDIFSQRRREGSPDPNVTEMRELERTIPISAHA